MLIIIIIRSSKGEMMNTSHLEMEMVVEPG
jgi:hypothetical protein